MEGEKPDDLPPAIRLRDEGTKLEALGAALQELWDSRVHYQVIMSHQGCLDMATELLPHAATKVGMDWSRIQCEIGDHGLHYLVRLRLIGSDAECCEVFVNAMPMKEVRPANVSCLLSVITGMAVEKVRSNENWTGSFADITAGMELVDEAISGCRVCDDRILLVGPTYRDGHFNLCFMTTIGERGDPGDASMFCQFEVRWE